MRLKNNIVRDQKYHDWIKTNACLVCSNPYVDAHHVWHSGGRYPNDHLLIPLCRPHHSDYHNHGHSHFETKWNVCLMTEIINYLSRYVQLEVK